MGWGIHFEDYLSRVTVSELESKQEELTESVQFYKNKILALCASSPFEVKDSSGYYVEWLDYVTYKFRELMEELENDIIELHKVNICIEERNNLKIDV